MHVFLHTLVFINIAIMKINALNKLLMTVLIALPGVCATAQDNNEINNDSTERKPGHVCIHSDGDRSWEVFSSGFYFGFGGNSSHGLTSLNKEVGFLNIVALGHNFGTRNRLSLGVGYQARYIDIKKGNMLNKLDDGVVASAPWPTEFSNTKSQITVHSIQFPLLYAKGFNKHLWIWLGPVLNWNHYAYFTNRHRLGDATTNVSVKGLKQRKISVDIMCGLAFRHMGIYLRYSPMSTFKKDFGPEIKNTVMAGLTFGF